MIVLKYLKSFLGYRNATLVCCLVAFFNKNIIAWIYTDLSYDKAFYFLFSKTIMKGYPPLEDTGLIMGVTNYYFNGAITSPIYTLLVIPFLWLTKSLFYTSCIIDALSWFIFFTALYRLSKQLLKERWLINLFICIVGFFLYPHELFSNPKDTLSLGLVCWACVLSSDIIQKPVAIQRTLALYIVLLTLGLTKLLFVPLPFFIIGTIIIFSIATKKIPVFKHGLLILFLLVLSAFLFSRYLVSLQNYYHQVNIIPSPIIENAIGFYPENLLKIFPFISSSLVDVTLLTSILSKIFNQPFEKIANFWKILDVVLMIFIAGLFFKRRPKNLLPNNILWMVCIGTCLSVLLMLCSISIIMKSSEEGLNRHSFTFIATPRFYIFIMLVIQMSIFYLIFKTNVPKFFKLIFFLLFFINSVHGAYFTIKQIVQKNKVRRELKFSNPVANVIDSYIKPIHKMETKFLFITPDKNLRRLAQINDVDVLFFSEKVLVPKEFKSIAVALPETDSALFKNYKSLVLFRSDTIKPFIVNFYTQ